MKDLKEMHEKPNEATEEDLATEAEKTRCIKLYGLLASLTALMPGGVWKKD